MRVLFSQLSSLLVALVFAGILWAIATSEENPSREAFFPDSLPIQVENQPADLIVYQTTAAAARVKVRAPLATWDQLRAESFRVTVNLKGVEIGSHQRQLRAQVTDPRAFVTAIEPPVVGVYLDQLKTREFTVETELLDALPTGYVSQTPVVQPTRVSISGPATLVDQIAQVSADISVRGAKTTFERQVSITALDARGNVVVGVTPVPASVSITVPVAQRVGYKDVSIKTVLKGAVASGYWISNIVVSPSTATVVGSAEVLSKVAGFIETMPIDVAMATGDIVKTVPLALPDGVSMLDNNGVTVAISITPILGGQTIRRAVTAQSLRRGLGVTFSPDTVEVILSGPLPVLASLTAQDVQVVVDASGLITGTYVLKPRAIIVPSVLKVQSILPDTVLVNIVEATPPR